MFPWVIRWNVIQPLEQKISRKKSTGAIQVENNKINSLKKKKYGERLKKLNVFSLVSSDM